MPRVKSHVADGEVVLVDKALVPQAKPVVELSHHAAEKLRPKRPLSEKQKENLAKLIERNRAKAAAWKAGKEAPSDLSAIPEDQVAVQVKPKRAYVRKQKGHYLSQPLPKPKEIKANTEPEPETEDESDVEPTPVQSPKKVRAKPKKRAEPETDEESEVEKPRRRRVVSDTSDFDSDDEYVQKYVAKTHQRLAAVQQIEKQIAQKINPYSSRGLSIF